MLRDWLLEKDASGSLKRDLQRLQVTLGPFNESFFATDGSSSVWLNLPAGLSTAMQRRRKPGGGLSDPPRLVALGAMQSYMMVTHTNGGVWSFPNYGELNAIIDGIKASAGDLSVIHVMTPSSLVVNATNRSLELRPRSTSPWSLRLPIS